MENTTVVVSEVMGKMSTVFKDACKELIIKIGEEYYIPTANDRILAKTRGIVVQHRLDNTEGVVIVTPEGRVLDTNLPLCDECGEPIVEVVADTFCSEDCFYCYEENQEYYKNE